MTKRPGTKKGKKLEYLGMIEEGKTVAEMMEITGTTKSNIFLHMKKLRDDGHVFDEPELGSFPDDSVGTPEDEKAGRLKEGCVLGIECIICPHNKIVNKIGVCDFQEEDDTKKKGNALSAVNQDVVDSALDLAKINPPSRDMRLFSPSEDKVNALKKSIAQEQKLGEWHYDVNLATLESNIEKNIAYLKHEINMVESSKDLDEFYQDLKKHYKIKDAIEVVKNYIDEE